MKLRGKVDKRLPRTVAALLPAIRAKREEAFKEE